MEAPQGCAVWFKGAGGIDRRGGRSRGRWIQQAGR